MRVRCLLPTLLSLSLFAGAQTLDSLFARPTPHEELMTASGVALSLVLDTQPGLCPPLPAADRALALVASCITVPGTPAQVRARLNQGLPGAVHQAGLAAQGTDTQIGGLAWNPVTLSITAAQPASRVLVELRPAAQSGRTLVIISSKRHLDGARRPVTPAAAQVALQRGMLPTDDTIGEVTPGVAYVFSGRTGADFGEVFEASRSGAVIVMKNGHTTLRLTLGRREATLGGKPVMLEGRPFATRGFAAVPLSAWRLLGCRVPALPKGVRQGTVKVTCGTQAGQVDWTIY
ncbi:hypothetical protein [Deinococcus hohokamensis]|uniref:Uncharacterized protein n=1 Tax=Deinococcus hohokamensis TaxID=309883 RepID=A0ABV9IAB5_9DEIO